jgi:hypothetical protein
MNLDRCAGLGYPKVQAFYRIAVGCGEVVELEEPEGVRIMHNIYLDMPSPMKIIVDTTYKKELPVKKAAKVLKVSPTKYRERLKECESFTQGCLSILSQVKKI